MLSFTTTYSIKSEVMLFYSNKGYGHYVVDNIVVDGTGPYYRYLTNGYHSWARPVPNEKSLKYRFYDILRTYDELLQRATKVRKPRKATGTRRKISISGLSIIILCIMNLTSTAKNLLMLFDLGAKYFPTEGDNSSATWTDQNSIAAQANMTTVRNITVNTKRFVESRRFL